MAEIVVVGAEWAPRALLKAQLEEQGHEVTGFADLAAALMPLRVGLLSPQLLILQTQGLSVDPAALARLRHTVGRVPVLIVSGPFEAAWLDFRALDFPHVLLRPVFIGDIVERAEQLLKRSAPDSGA